MIVVVQVSESGGFEETVAVVLNIFVPQLRRGVREKTSVLLHGGTHDLAVGPEPIRCVLERVAVLLHSGEHDVAVGLELLA